MHLHWLILLFLPLFFCVQPTEYSSVVKSSNIKSTTLSLTYENYNELAKSHYLTNWFATGIISDTGTLDAKIRIHGGISKHYLKNSYKVISYDGYPVSKSDSRIYSAQYGDITYCKSRLNMHLFKKAGFYCPDINPVHLFFKDWYQGIYLEIEEIDELFFQRRMLPVSSLYFSHPHVKFTLHDGYTPENSFEKELPQNDLNYSDLLKLFIIVDRGITVKDTAELNTILDVKNVLDYYTIATIIKHGDGIVNNLVLYFNPEILKFQLIPWDLVVSLTGENDLSNPAYKGYKNNLFDQMIKIEAWNKYCVKRARELFDFEEMNELLTSYSQEVKVSQINDPTIPISENQFDEAVESIRNYYYNLDTILKKTDVSFK